MNKYIISHLNTASLIIKNYQGEEPFPEHLRNFFRQSKKHGSHDRKVISNLCFAYLRIGKMLDKLTIHQQIVAGFFLTNYSDIGLIQNREPAWMDKFEISLMDKISFLESIYGKIELEQVFPFLENVSNQIDKNDLINSCFSQSNTFLRSRPGKENLVESQLKSQNINFKRISSSSFSLHAGGKIDAFLDINKDVVIQDLSSQRIAGFLPEIPFKKPDVWDACAASGGKSILANDHYGNINLYVSDIRNMILEKLYNRLKDANIQPVASFKIDLTEKIPQNSSFNFPMNGFDLIIADVPCSGSGTWSRNPELLRFFSIDQIYSYAQKQKSITRNLIPYVKKGGYLLYITCSVYRQENEDVVESILQQPNMKLIKSALISDYQLGADALFAALFISRVE